MAKHDKYIAVLEDEEGERWVYEGSVQGIPIWTPENQSKPKILSEVEAFQIVNESKQAGDISFVKRA